MPASELLPAALEYAAAGIAVFPCVPDGKAPVTLGGYKDATTDLAQIGLWWRGGARYNIGLCPADAGWIVLNADLYKGGDPDLLARLPATFTVETPRGGKHLYFESPVEHGNAIFDEHIDVRSANGYVLAPESIVNGKPYRVISNCGRLAPFPDWAAERLAFRAGQGGEKKPRNRFGGLSPSEGATLPPLSYWDDNATLPRSNKGGCAGFLVGQFGSHKTGTAIMMGLDAIEQHGARVLFIAAEDANGVAKARLPAACKARGLSLEKINPHWRTEAETFDLLSETDRADMIEAYRDWPPNLIFIDVLTRVVTADINAPETGMRVMQAVYALAAPFRATAVIAHHPGLNGGGRPMGSSLFTSLADFCLKASHKAGLVSIYIEKMKNGPDGFTVRYQTELVPFDTDDFGLPVEAPVVRALTAAELEEHKAKRTPKPNIEAENATDDAAVARLERLAPDVVAALRRITVPMLLRETAPMLAEAKDDADLKDEEKGTPFASRIRRLGKLIGTPKAPGILAPFTAPRTGGRTSPHRLMPIAPLTKVEFPAETEPSDVPAS
jgi:hypothetical protein